MATNTFYLKVIAANRVFYSGRCRSIIVPACRDSRASGGNRYSKGKRGKGESRGAASTEAEYPGVLSLKSFAGPCHDTTESNFRKIINVNKLQKRGCDNLFFVYITHEMSYNGYI